jgi:molybdopterin biosynthesis enzyme
MKKIKLPLARRINSELGRHQIITVKIVDGKIEPVFKSSGAITSISDADGYIEIPVFVDLMEKGEIAEAILF